jgi:uncharacterized protein
MDLQLIIILSILFVSGLVKGTTGFGFALFSLPLLAHYISFKTLVPLLTLFNLVSSAQMIIQTREFKPDKRIIWLSIAGIAGTFVGTLVLKFFPAMWLKIIASVSLVTMSTLFITGYRFKVRRFRRSNVIAGLISGFLGGTIAVSGPPLALFLTSLKVNAHRFSVTFAWFSVITAGFAFVDQIKIGVVNHHVFNYFLYGWPVVFISVIIGKWLNKIVPVKVFYKAVVIITFISGAFLFISCFRDCIQK